ncbi:SEC-C metal-binding domain-containing protein [Pseudoxanthomonas mexicana]
MARPPLGKLNFRLPDSLRDRAQAIADRDNVSLNSVLLKALENYVPFRERQHQDQDKKAQKRLQQRVPRTPDALLAPVPKVGAKQRCPCGSGLQYKRCHGMN